MNTIHKTRLAYLFFIFMTIFIGLLIRIYILQIKQTAFFSGLAHQQHNVTKISRPTRAEIYDRNGQTIALNKETYAAFILPSKLKEGKKVADFLKIYFPDAHNRLLKNQKSHFLYIKRRLNLKEKMTIESAKIADIKLLSEPGRYYPISGLSSILGITDIDNKGILGLELQYNSLLAGNPTTYILDKDARSGHFYFKKETKIVGTEGSPLKLTIDSSLQFLVYEELRELALSVHADDGAVIIINPENGEILVMANYPDFDPKTSHAFSDITYSKNRTVTERYEPGSVMKTFLALAAFQENAVQPEELIDCLGSASSYIDGVKISTWMAHGIIPFTEVITRSNNIGCVKIAQRLGTKLYDYYKLVGFGNKTTVGFPGEQTGYVTPPEKWTKSSLFTLSYGYGISTTLLQLARAFCLIANGGYYIEPKIILNNPTTKETTPRFHKKALMQIKEVLEKTVADISGTAKKARIAGYRIMGKTGTANLLENGVYNTHHNIFTFIGIIEKDSYKRVILTFIKGAGNHTTHASSITAPLFESVAQKMLIHDKIIV